MRSCSRKAMFQSETHLDLLLDVLDGVRGLDIQGNGLALHRHTTTNDGPENTKSLAYSEGLDEDLHAAATTQTQHQVQGGLLLDVVVSQSAAILQLLASEDQTLLVRRDALLVLHSVTDSH